MILDNLNERHYAKVGNAIFKSLLERLGKRAENIFKKLASSELGYMFSRLFSQKLSLHYENVWHAVDTIQA